MVTVASFDRDIVQIYREALARGDAGALLDAAAEYVYRTEPHDWITHWRRLNRARFYACAVRWPAVKSLAVTREAL